MPRAPKKCAKPTCEARVTARTYCDEHTPAWLQSKRPGSTRASRRVRADVLRRDPTCTCPGCRACTASGCSRASTEDDHKVNLATGGTDHPANHRGICTPCHKVKTAHEAAVGRR